MERELVAEAGLPIADATVFEAPWYRGAGVWYEHRYDPPAVFEWLDALPGRLGCVSYESDDLIPPAEGWSALYWFSCRLQREGRVFVVSVKALLGEEWSSTTVVAYASHD